ncbi:hypothetical protein L249_4620 [Ophiocordyceps polyrhachis-furcata BCC 54312]|uniref:Glycosyl transferase CAP10 domain-containing protein n=1 Tax=Ophiocordyceps polyrhachis-furcata BCC 54312 TaxID=1330021 RepID=A0A367LC21_9HYPO|nr:hypothetical protein L249_4620 [Ophiocordyceps polyrhachis-furcata BCC 54312]
MARCVASFGLLSESLRRHSLAGEAVYPIYLRYCIGSLQRRIITLSTEQPRLSFAAVLTLAGACCFVASYRSKWASLGDGRFAGGKKHVTRDGPLPGAATDEALLNGSSSHLPDRPRRYSLSVLILCVVIRLEIFHRVNCLQQCASPGIESFLCPLLICYEIYSSRRSWGVPPTENDDDPWRSVFDDLYDWFTGPRVTMVLMLTSACIFSLGTYLSTSRIMRSTYICFSPLDSRATTLLWQFIGLLLDAVIIVLLWRTLAWTRTAKQRLRTLASVFALSSLAFTALWLCTVIMSGGLHRYDLVFGSLHGYDFLVDSAALAMFATCMGLWVCQTSPITPVSIMTFLVGAWSSMFNVFRLGDWTHLSRANDLLPVWLIASGTVLFTYTHDIRSVLFIPRPFLTFMFMLFLLVATIIAFRKQMMAFDKRHPINDLIFQAQTDHNRWLLEAGTSQSFPVAVEVYEERHSGRAPPPNFSEWYQYAAESLVKDDFKQIDQDLAPFWSFTPAHLRDAVDALASDPSVSVITIKDGDVGRRASGGEDESRDLDEMVEMIQKFSKHLADMVLPVNLSPSPRVLPSWNDVQLHSLADVGLDANFVRREHSDTAGLGHEVDSLGTTKAGLTRASEFRQMQQEACHPASRARTRQHWSFEKFCTECVKEHSQGQLLSNFQRSLDLQLVPLFGPSKTDEFRDIIIPLPRSRLEKPDMPWQFSRRYDNMFWRGAVGDDNISDPALRGSQKFRLLHLLNRPHVQDKVTVILPTAQSNSTFGAESVSAVEANRALPISAGMTNYSPCLGKDCQAVKLAFGTEADSEEALEYRYVLLTDEDDGPPGEVLRTIRSGSVPFVSTIFRTWYAERLTPWLHFVPIDVRYQALHTTFSYFTGTKDRPRLNGRETQMEGREGDGEWISRRGQKWAEQALSKKDMEVYLFRLLLEWGRLVDDRRGELEYRRDDRGSLENLKDELSRQ